MIACVSPAGTLSVSPLMISAPPTATWRSLTSNTLLLVLLVVRHRADWIAIGLGRQHEPGAGNDRDTRKSHHAHKHVAAGAEPGKRYRPCGERDHEQIG